MNDLLSSRLVYPNETLFKDDQSYRSRLVGLSFDSTVCSNFDSLSLDENYFQNI